MTAIVIFIFAIMAFELIGLKLRISAYRQEVIDVKTYYNKVLRNNAEITVALFPQIIRELEELGEAKEANKCKGILADAENTLAAKKEWVYVPPPPPKFTFKMV